jgi:hypothetical protein
MVKAKEDTICALDWKGRILVGGAFGVGVDQSMCSSILSLPLLLLQEEVNTFIHTRVTLS